MRTVTKQILQKIGPQEIDFPDDALSIFCAHDRHGELFISLLTNADARTAPRTVYVIADGHEIPDEASWHLGSAVDQTGIIWHVFTLEDDDRSLRRLNAFAPFVKTRA